MTYDTIIKALQWLKNNELTKSFKNGEIESIFELDYSQRWKTICAGS